MLTQESTKGKKCKTTNVRAPWSEWVSCINILQYRATQLRCNTELAFLLLLALSMLLWWVWSLCFWNHRIFCGWRTHDVGVIIAVVPGVPTVACVFTVPYDIAVVGFTFETVVFSFAGIQKMCCRRKPAVPVAFFLTVPSRCCLRAPAVVGCCPCCI